MNCPDCYNLVQDAADDHRRKLAELNSVLRQIEQNPTVIDDAEFEGKLKTVQEKIDILAEDARSGAGGGDRTLVERIGDLEERLRKIHQLIAESNALESGTNRELAVANRSVADAEHIIKEALGEISAANDLLNSEGALALTKARERAEQYGHQSNTISDISRQARAKVDQLDKEVAESKQNALEANDKAAKAYDLARNALSQQQEISDELRSTIRNEIQRSKDALENAIRLTADALDRANKVYDEALTLIASVQALATPDPNLEKLRSDAVIAIKNVRIDI